MIPTFNEKQNVEVIVEKIKKALHNSDVSYEIWFIDDSNDETPLVLHKLSKIYENVNYTHREGERGLASAVVEGFRRAVGECFVVMDADLQHPPELIPVIYRRIRDGIDIVIPSRFVDGGTDGGLNIARKLVSATARTLGRLSLKRLKDISDCTGGYFGIHRNVIKNAPLNPIGWKILMEVLVKGKYSTVHEIPYHFSARNAGDSKMSMREQWNYLRHIVALVHHSPEDRRFYMFCIVGALGTIVNLIIMTILLKGLHLPTTVSSIVASLTAMLHNFVWHDRVTWKGHHYPVLWRRILQFPQFITVSAVGVAITTLVAEGFMMVHWSEIWGQLTGIIGATAWSFLANNYWTWSERTLKPERTVISVTHERIG